MFICEDCAKSKLSKEGNESLWMVSYGDCEFCEKFRKCNDVKSYCKWAWKKNEKEPKRVVRSNTIDNEE